MGWENYHRYEFNLEGYRIGEIIEEEKIYGFGCDRLLDAKSVKLCDLVSDLSDEVTYSYDFGDGWQHQLEVEEFLALDQSVTYPTCIDGEMACPPEDCGGIHSFYHYLDILKDKTVPDYNLISQGFKKKYNPENFNKQKINKQLKTLPTYIRNWLKRRGE